jgi:hypothetical protein
MKNGIACVAAAIAVASGAVCAQEAITLDLSKMKGSPVAMVAGPMTNKLVLWRRHPMIMTTNLPARCVPSVDRVIEDLREQGRLAALVKTLVEAGDVCAVVGHRWEWRPHVTLEYRADGDYPVYRQCSLCGKVQTKEPGTWK